MRRLRYAHMLKPGPTGTVRLNDEVGRRAQTVRLSLITYEGITSTLPKNQSVPQNELNAEEKLAIVKKLFQDSGYREERTTKRGEEEEEKIVRQKS